MSLKTATEALPGLLSFWELQETTGTVAKDAKGFHNGKFEGAVKFGKTGPVTGSKAIELQGGATNEYVEITNSGYENPELTVGIWVKLAVIPTEMGIFCTGEYNFGSPGIVSPSMEIGAGGTTKRLQWGNFNTANAGTFVVATQGSELATETWYFLAGTYDANNWKLYVNGVQVAEEARKGVLAYSKQLMNLGRMHAAEPGKYLKGLISYAFICNKAESAESLLAIFTASQEGKPVVETGPPSALTGTKVTLNGTINPNGNNVTKAEVLWGLTKGSLTEKAKIEPLPGSGTEAVPCSVKLEGLTAGKRYYYQFEAESALGQKTGGERSVRTTDTGGENAYKEAVEASGANLVAYWRLNEPAASTEALDYGFTGKGVAKQGAFGKYEAVGNLAKAALVFQQGPIVSQTGSNAVQFLQGGTGPTAGAAVVTLPGVPNAPLREPTTEMTFECWYERLAAVNHAAVMFDLTFDPGNGLVEPYPGIPAATTWGYSFGVQPNNKLFLDFCNETGGGAEGGPVTEAFRPYHFVITFKEGVVKLYINGESVAVININTPTSIGYTMALHPEVNEQTGAPPRIAHNGGEVEGESTPPNTTHFWYRDSTSHVLSEVSIVKKALTEAQAIEHYELGARPIIKSMPAAGYGSIKIKGEHFSLCSVAFGTTLSKQVTVVSEKEIIAKVPPLAPGAVNVVITTSEGNSAAKSFTVEAEPEVKSTGVISVGKHFSHIRTGANL